MMRLRPVTAAMLCFVAAAPVCGEPDQAEDTGDTSTTDGTDVETDTDDPEADTDWRDHDVGPVAVCFAVPSLWVMDDGNGPIRLDGTASFARGLSNLVAWEWSVVSAPLGSQAQPEVRGPGQAWFDADASGEYDFELIVTDEHGEVSAPCTVGATVVTERPTVDCRVAEQATLQDPGMLEANATGAYPPFSYRWTLVEDTSGSAALDTPLQASTQFAAESIGTLFTSVVAQDAMGVSSEACDLEVPALYLGSVNVELTWSLTGDDLDLHLIREPGTLDSDEDCHYANCRGTNGLDWGVPWVVEDNPQFHNDYTAGTGPEYIHVSAPASSVMETWRIVVVDSEGLTQEGPNAATISVRLDNEIVLNTTFDVVGEGTITDVATIEVPTGVVTSLLP